MSKILYHATPKNNTFAIMREGIKAGFDGYIYFCETPDACLIYMKIAFARRQGFKRGEFATIPIEFTDKEFSNMEKNLDNYSIELPTAYAYEGNVTADRIPQNLNLIPLYEISMNKMEGAKHEYKGI